MDITDHHHIANTITNTVGVSKHHSDWETKSAVSFNREQNARPLDSGNSADCLIMQR